MKKQRQLVSAIDLDGERQINGNSITLQLASRGKKLTHAQHVLLIKDKTYLDSFCHFSLGWT